ncbi:MAG: type III secretion system export apparatus subunit SctU [Reinekea sp.]|jgi:type III secretion protein U
MSGEKTEKATPKKLQDARKKGQVPQSKDIVSTATLTCMIVILLAGSNFYMTHFSILIGLPDKYIGTPFLEALPLIMDDVIHEIALLSGIPIIFVMATAILANFLQVGAIFSTDPITPKFEKMNPIKGFKNIFSIKNLIEFIKSIIKVSVLSWIIYVLIKNHLNDSAKLHYCELQCIPTFTGSLVKILFLVTILVFTVMAAADYFIQKQQFMKQQKMSKDEVKREYKQTEGSPEIKSNRKRFHRELMNSSTPMQVKKSTVIVTNPTHLAVGIFYDKNNEDSVPEVTVKGADNMAQLIKEIAKAENIPIMENVPLARGLWATADVGDYVPMDLFEAVAAVLQWVDSLEDE